MDHPNSPIVFHDPLEKFPACILKLQSEKGNGNRPFARLQGHTDTASEKN